MNNIHLIYDVLPNKERLDLIKKSKKFLLDEKELLLKYPSLLYYPGKQTDPILHKITQFKKVHEIILSKIYEKTGIKFSIYKSWVNYTRGKDLCWHSHPSKYSLVYYMKTIPLLKNGTLFKEYGMIETKQNSVLVFPSHLVHTAPKYIFPFERYSLAMELF